MRIRLIHYAFYEPPYRDNNGMAPGVLSAGSFAMGMAQNAASSAAAEASDQVCSFDLLDEALVVITSAEAGFLLDSILTDVFDDLMLHSKDF
ncbi:hypothetical protein NDU88_000652 [Pleurodeles waltl]|uniref:Uncharacterized protein n=1 Tax=Pleurodeles waltl TaxID=8319 RepID=A0AAV7V5P1_PLEWA|nr:hypothetical protein NDU88_000652 [Pleurodeles waltl]